MLTVSQELKSLYKQDDIHKTLSIYFPALDLTINNQNIVSESFELTESICSDSDLVFGSCEASQIKFTVADVDQDLKGLWFTISQVVNGATTPLGTYKADSCKKQGNLRFKDIIAYDALKDTDVDVSDWYNSLFPTGDETYTLAQFRASLLAYFNIEENISNLPLPNDNMVVKKTIEPTQISGRDVLQACEEINGSFGRMGRNGKFKHIVLQPGYGLYPSETLYPSDDLFPVDENDTSYVHESIIDETIGRPMYKEVKFEEYTVKEIDKLQIRAEENDIGAIVGGDQRRVIDTQTGTSIQSTKSDDSVVEITKIEGATTVTPTNPLLDISPDNVAIITSANNFDVVACGKNLLPRTPYTSESHGIRFEINHDDNSVTVTGTASSQVAVRDILGRYNTTNDVLPSLSGKTVTLSGGSDDVFLRLTYYDGSIFTNIETVGSSSRTVAIPQDSVVTRVVLLAGTNRIINTTVYPMIELGSTPSPYEPYKSNKLTITKELNKLPNGVADTMERLDDKYVKYTHRIGKVVFDGSVDENWEIKTNTSFGNRYIIYIPNSVTSDTNNSTAICSHFKLGSAGATWTHGNVFTIASNSALYISKNNESLAEFKTFLQANPVTVLYELAEPIEEIVEEPSQLTSYKGITNITTNANPQVSLTADFCVNPINTYVIEGNFLAFGKSASELETIALNAFGNMAKRPYRPYQAESIGLPYIEVGDTIEIATDDVITGYVLQRTLTGIQALKDEYTATGNEEREQNFGLNTEVINLKGRYNKIKKDVDGISMEVGNLETRTEAKFELTDEKISLEAQRAIGAEGALSGQINVLAGQVILKVDANGNIAAVELDADASEGSAIKIKADNIGLEGLITANGNFKILADGSMEATNGKFSGDITGSSITGTTFMQTGSKGTVKIEDGGVIADYVLAQSFASDSISLSGNMSCDNMQCNTINSYKPIHSGNIGQQSVEYAASADISNYAQNANDANHAGNSQYAYGLVSYGAPIGSVYVSSNGNFRPYGDSSRSCGTSEGRWSSVWALNGAILTSDERQKEEITLLEDDERFLKFTKMIVPYTFKMKAGTSGRRHVGFIAQRIEEAMIECNISSMEFAGLIKAPVYARNILTEDGKDTGEYDTTSEIIDYTYHLRYDEFIPLIFLWLRNLS